MKLGGPLLLIVIALDLVGLFVSGGLAGFIGLVAIAGVLIPAPRASARALIPVHVAALAGLGTLVFLGDSQDGLAVLVGWLLVHRVWTGTSRTDARLSLLLGTLLLLLGCLRTESLAMAPVLAALACLVPAALLRIEVGPELRFGWRSVVTGIAVTLGACGLFFLLPRLNAGYLATQAGSTAASEVLLGDDQNDVRGDQAVVMHVEVTTLAGAPVPGPFYLRGRGLDHFDGARWSATLPTQRARGDNGSGGPNAADAQADVELAPAADNVAFAPFEALDITGIGSVFQDGDGTLFHHEGGRGTRYRALLRRGDGTMPTLDARTLQALKQIPELDPRVEQLARSIAPGETDPVRIASAMKDYLSQNLSYLANPPPPDGDALASFLFVRKAGHCEYFATALAVMLRVRGVPTRLGTGYWSGELDPDGHRIIVRGAHAHAWTEVPTSTGWQIFDASPVDGLPSNDPPGAWAWLVGVQGRWSEWVLEYDLGDQADGLETIGRSAAAAAGQSQPQWAAGTGLVVTFVILGIGYFIASLIQLLTGVAVVQRRKSPSDPLARVAARARARLRPLGVDAPDVPLALLTSRLPEPVAGALQRVADAVNAGKYGNMPMAEALREARSADAALASAVRVVRVEQRKQRGKGLE
jgi:transglutaminase-like putative cysteine protease